MGRALTMLVWTASVLSVAIGGLVATEFVFMATSLDPSELAAGGIETWIDALKAGAAFGGLIVVTVLGLFLWHSQRFKVAGLVLTICEIGGVGWICTKVYTDYF